RPPPSGNDTSRAPRTFSPLDQRRPPTPLLLPPPLVHPRALALPPPPPPTRKRKTPSQTSSRSAPDSPTLLSPRGPPGNGAFSSPCRTCQYTEEAQSSCVFRNIMNNAAGETA
ncbi:hypothetical protein jhhlp_006695, partial [Lomentospora prolificans]